MPSKEISRLVTKQPNPLMRFVPEIVTDRGRHEDKNDAGSSAK